MKVTWRGRPVEIDGDQVYYLDGEMETISEIDEIFEIYSEEISQEKQSFHMMIVYDSSKGH